VLGASFLLTSDQLSELRACDDDDAREDWLMALEEDVANDRWFQFDKAWDPLHRALGDGELLIQHGPPRAHAVFGSEPLMEREEADMFAGLLPADAVSAVVAELTPLDRDWLRARIVEDDLEYVTEALAGLREFLDRAAHQHAAVVFTVSG
jgi:hypothetical protein